MRVNEEIERLLMRINTLESKNFAGVIRKTEDIEELARIFLKQKLPINCLYLITRYNKDGVKGILYRRGLIQKVNLNGKLDVEMICNPGEPSEFVERILVDLKDVIQFEVEEEEEKEEKFD